MDDGATRVLHVLGGILVALACGAVTVLLAVVTFDVNPAGPVIVSLAALVGGAFAISRGHDFMIRGAGYGLVVGALVAILLWPLFAVD
jgi:hypothetical protein